MRIFKIAVPALLAAGVLLSLSGCGHQPAYRDSGPQTLSGDVIVVGDSLAGLVAALEAARQGAAVMLFYGKVNEDSWIWNEGAVMPEASEKEAVTALRAALGEHGGGHGKTWHFELLARRAASDLAWLAGETGLILARDGDFRYRPENISLTHAYAQLVEAALREGVRFFKGVTVRELIMAGDGAASGILFESPPGVLRAAYAQAVILADGGYLGDTELLDEYAPPAVIPASWRSGREAAGLRLGLAAGLDLVGEDLFSYAPAFEENNRWVKASWPAGTVLIVDGQLVSLDDLSEQQAAALLLSGRDNEGFLLVGEAFLGPDRDLHWPRFDGIEAFMETYRLEIPALRGWFAQPRGVFLGRPVRAVAEYCLGGLAVNEAGEALKDNVPVPGLYVIGEAAGGLHGLSLMPGAALTEAVVWGRWIGREAAQPARR
jgi:succinate dehydrogenase/fumarate reductase flavoprotein subunit